MQINSYAYINMAIFWSCLRMANKRDGKKRELRNSNALLLINRCMCEAFGWKLLRKNAMFMCLRIYEMYSNVVKAAGPRRLWNDCVGHISLCWNCSLLYQNRTYEIISQQLFFPEWISLKIMYLVRFGLVWSGENYERTKIEEARNFTKNV